MSGLHTPERQGPPAGAVKAGLVLAGYAAAFGIASIVVIIRIALSSDPEAEAASGMYAFGDSLLFLFVFSLVGIVPTVMALRLLQHRLRFWSMLAFTALAVAASGIAALLAYLAGTWTPPPRGSGLEMMAVYSVLRLLLTPILAGAFLVCTLLAPTPASRRQLRRATSIEFAVCAALAFCWFVQLQMHR